MNALIGLFLQPILNATLEFVVSLLQDIAPEVAADISSFLSDVEQIAGAVVTTDLTLPEALDSLKIEANLLKQRGETILIQVQANAEKFPAKMVGLLTGLVGNVIGPLEKIAGL